MRESGCGRGATGGRRGRRRDDRARASAVRSLGKLLGLGFSQGLFRDDRARASAVRSLVPF